MELGIVGLPNVGKSTLFNALTENAVPAENYPFCTVDPNVGVVPIPDDRLDRLDEWVDAPKTTPAVIEFKDIAGLVPEAHQGEGLGNQFLSQIRTVDAVCHVVRLFEHSDVSHVEGTIDPQRDLDIIETEFALADLDVLDDPIEKLEKRTRVGNEDLRPKLEFYQELRDQLSSGEHLGESSFDQKQERWLQDLDLLSPKPVLVVLNVDEETVMDPDQNQDYQELIEYIESETSHEHVTICAELESEIVQMEPQERRLFLDNYGLDESGLERLAREAYDLLGLISYFTFNENELRAWSLEQGGTALEAAGQIHSDFREQFIKAEVINYSLFEEHKSWKKAKEAGAVRSRGEDYVVQDGDIIYFQANA